jgi:hypothetical protein
MLAQVRGARMIVDADKVRGARARLSHAATNYLAAIEEVRRLSVNGNDPRAWRRPAGR